MRDLIFSEAFHALCGSHGNCEVCVIKCGIGTSACFFTGADYLAGQLGSLGLVGWGLGLSRAGSRIPDVGMVWFGIVWYGMAR